MVCRARLGVERLDDRAVPAFLAPISSTGGGSAVAAGDVNHDTRDDIAVITTNKVISVSLSNGDGTFRLADKVSGAKGYYRTGFHLIDMNHDGNLDIVLSQASQKYRKACCSLFGPIYEQTIFSNVWLGRGDGTFGRVSTTTRVVTLSAPLNHDYILTGTFADVNRDDKPDEIWLGAPGILNVRLSNGDGTYQLPRTFDAGPAPETLAVGDFDGDGWVDVIVVNAQPSSAPTLSVLINDRTW
ncbi:MAG TPA: VCBS repeat-containing protein [Gemmataceae bacterium]|nr:VCBS repeat-containing protein [Gemmataceae bacterium]